MKTLKIPEQKTPHFSMPEHTVTVNRDLSKLKKALSQTDIEDFFRLYEEAQTAPRKTRKRVQKLLSIYPHQAEILNLQTYILLCLKKGRQARALIIENYEHNPDSLLAKINYADLCVRRKKLGEIPKIFDNAWHLRAVCPERKTFHLSEFRGFMVLMAYYHVAIKKPEVADCYFYLAHTVDGQHSSVQLLKKKMYQQSFLKKLKLV